VLMRLWSIFMDAVFLFATLLIQRFVRLKS